LLLLDLSQQSAAPIEPLLSKDGFTVLNCGAAIYFRATVGNRNFTLGLALL
jgi:hypothetical protein